MKSYRKREYPLAKIRRYLEPGPIVPVSSAWKGKTILNVSTGAKEKGITAGIAVGAVIALEAMFARPICGASMNPARSLAPALVSGHFEHLWIRHHGL